MNSRFTSLVGCGIVTLLMTLASVTSLNAQFKVIKGYQGSGAFNAPSYSYSYVNNYPNTDSYSNTYAGYLWMYTYYTRGFSEFVVTKDNMLAAGLCPGPIDAMSFQFLKTSFNFQGRWRIFIKSIPSTQYILNWPNNSNPNQSGEPYNTNFYTVSGLNFTYGASAGGLRAAPGAVEVHDDPNWQLPVLTDTTWVDWTFNKNTFVWDGNSNIVIGMLRCWPEGGPYNYDYYNSNMFMTTYVNPPVPYDAYYGTNWPNYFPWVDFYYSYPGAPGTCATGPYYPYYTYYYTYAYQYNYNTGNYDYFNYFWMRPLIRLRVSSGLVSSFPDDVDPRRILRATEVYDGADITHPKPSVTYYGQTGKTYSVKYKITGPNPSTNTVYEARLNGNATIPINSPGNGQFTFTMPDAVGSFAGTAGALDLTNAGGGSYKVIAEFTSDCGMQQWAKQFIVAFPWDVAMAEIRSPIKPPKKNPLNITLPLSAQIQNVGLNNITDVDVNVVVRKYPSGVQVFDHQVKWTGNMATGERGVVDLVGKAFIPTEVGSYTAEFCATLNDAFDQQAINDCLPSVGDTHIFDVNYNSEAGAGTITNPSSTGQYFANRALQPSGTIFNNGILDLSDIPVRMEVFKLPGGQKVYSEQVLVQSVDAAAPNNFAGVYFPLFTPDAAGQYQACLTVLYPGDPDKTNDQVCSIFTVGANLSGTYTIGTTKAGQANNFLNFQVATNTLYQRGVSGPVIFELTDASYTLNSSVNTNNVALDLSGYVPGMSATNTVTFKPSLERSLSKGSVTITLNSAIGIGVLFGQQLNPSNQASLAVEFPFVRSYSNSAGYYIFDGGLQKSIRVQLGATTAFRAPFYLGNGSQNITL
ncbi:MAG: hypothetical protein HYX66_10075, partial [Ignavibacteria bacterium]|nr:hypothetical protein [Ignavibacteria bacterium]